MWGLKKTVLSLQKPSKPIMAEEEGMRTGGKADKAQTTIEKGVEMTRPGDFTTTVTCLDTQETCVSNWLDTSNGTNSLKNKRRMSILLNLR